MEPQQKNALDYLDIVRRRKYYLLVPFVCILLISIVVAFVLPPIYKSSCTILIESQQIPSDFIRSTVSSYAEQTIQIITQQIQSRRNLLDIIERLNLYPDLRQKKTTEEIIEKMRDSIDLEMISTNVADQRSYRATTVTIAFTLSFEGKDPEKVLKVTNILSSLYLEENLKHREERAKSTSAFIEEELKGIAKNIDQLELEIAKFKEEHFLSLPEMTKVNFQMLQRFEGDLARIEQQIKNLEERKIYLEGQLATIDPYLPGIKGSSGRSPDAKERLATLYTDYLVMKASFSNKHPQMIRTKKIIEALEEKVSVKDALEIKQQELQKLKEELATKSNILSETHPDMIKLKKAITHVEDEIARTITEDPISQKEIERQENPAYININTQIATTEMDIKSLKEESISLQEKIDDYQKRQELAPQIEQEYNLLTRDYNNARLRYQETLNKLMEAKAAESLERDQMGEKFTIVDPAFYPEEPYKPNRLAIILIGFILAIGLGVGCAAIREFSDQAIYSEAELAGITHKTVLASISFMETAADKRKKVKRRILILFVILVIILLSALLFHLFIRRLDILWFKILDRGERIFQEIIPKPK
ncbi:MAG: GumC family protein [bacterium]